MQTGNIHKNRDVQQFCTFRIGRRLFGVRVTDVKEIHPVVTFTPVFHATEDVKGIVNIRGQVHLIVDLRVLLGFESRPVDDSSQIILFKPHVGEAFGILVDRIGDVAETDTEKIETLGEKETHLRDRSLHFFSDLVEGISTLEKELLVILNSSDLLLKMEEKQNKGRVK